jgi:hypothetical protein
MPEGMLISSLLGTLHLSTRNKAFAAIQTPKAEKQCHACALAAEGGQQHPASVGYYKVIKHCTQQMKQKHDDAASHVSAQADAILVFPAEFKCVSDCLQHAGTVRTTRMNLSSVLLAPIYTSV